MKLTTSNPFLSTIATIAALLVAPLANATNYYWDANGGTAGTGGTGIWDDSSSFWANGSAGGPLEAWLNTAINIDTAQLAGTAGTITLNSSSVNINVNKIVFSTNNYIINGPGSGLATLNLSGITPTIDTGANTATINAVITGSAGLTKSGNGTLNLSGNNSYTGVTAITGFVNITNANALGATGAGNHTTIAATGSNNTVTTGGQLQLNGGTFTSAENITISGTTEANNYAAAIVVNSGDITLSGNISLVGTTGGIRLNAQSGNLTFSGNISQTTTTNELLLQGSSTRTLTVNNAIANNGAGLVILGGGGANGVVLLKAASGSGIGSTRIYQTGTLKLGVTDAVNTAADLTIGASWSNTTGTFDLAGFNQTVKALIGEGSAANTGRIVTNSAAGTGTSTLTVGNGDGSGTYTGVITNGGTAKVALTKIGVGTQTLATGNTYTGGTIVSAGTLQISANNALADTGAVTVNGTGTFGIQTFSDTVGAVTLTSGSITGSTGVLIGSSYNLESGSVSAKLGGSAALNKSTAGTVTLTGANTYTGLTSISGAGTLALGAAGSIDNSSGVALGTAGTFNVSAKVGGYTVANLTGSGTVIGALTVSTGLAIGNSTGSISTQALTLGGSSTFEVDGGTTGATSGDLGDVNGLLTISLGATLDLVQLGSYTTNDKFTLFAYDTLSGTFSGLADEATFADDLGGTWKINYDDTTAGLNGGTGTAYITITAIPEPGAALIGSLGLLALLRRRRN